MSGRAASSRRPAMRSCSSPTRSAPRSARPSRKWSGNSAGKRDAARNHTNPGGGHMQYLIGLGGIVVILAIALLFSSNRRWIRLRVVGAAFALQAAIAALVLGTSGGQYVIGGMSTGVPNLLG